MGTFSLRILKSTWGIAIDLTAEVVAGVAPPSGVPIGDRLGLSFGGSPRLALSSDEVAFLVSGLRRVASQIEDAVPGEQPITVKIRDLTFAPADYQPEGLEPAIVGWAAEEIGFEPPVPAVTFDRAVNRYVFAYGEAPGHDVPTGFDAWNEALAADEPLKALCDVARRRVSDGAERDDLVAELQELVEVLYREDREADADTVLEVMDFLTGFCSPGIEI